jgi:predicted dehydrogenase
MQSSTLASAESSCYPKLRVGIIGCGLRSTSFIDYFSRNPAKGDIVAVCDIFPEKAELLVKHYGSKAAIFDNANKMMQEVKPDAIIIATPDFAHVEPAVSALKANIHVYCEKPMATTLEDCDTIIDAAKKSSAIFYLGFNLRHGLMHETIHNLVTSGRLGKVTTIEANEYYYGGKTYFRRWNRLERFGGGLWLTKASHDFDLLNWMAGAEPVSIYATANLSHYTPRKDAATRCRDCASRLTCPDFCDILNPRNNEVEEIWRQFGLINESKTGQPCDLCLFNSDKDTFDNGIAVINFQNDIRATYTVNVLTGRTTRQMRIIGTEGMLEGDMEKGTITLVERHSFQTCTYDLRAQMNGGHGGADDRIMNDFLLTLHQNKKPRSGWAEGRLAVKVALAARESCARDAKIVL